jgi:hypothetical protein
MVDVTRFLKGVYMKEEQHDDTLEDHDDKMLDDGSMTNGNGQIILPKIRLL